MALFGRKKKNVVVEKAPKAATKVASKPTTPTSAGQAHPVHIDTTSVLIGPRITEKSTMKADTENVFVFEIAQSANKVSVRQAITAMFNVVPIKVSIARNPSKNVISRGKRGVVSGVKKAYVYLKEGDKIEIV